MHACRDRTPVAEARKVPLNHVIVEGEPDEFSLCLTEDSTEVFISKQPLARSLSSAAVHRPTGVTIIAILNIIGGIIMLFGVIALVAAGSILPSMQIPDNQLSGVPSWLLGTGAIAIGIIIIILGIISFVVAYGLLKGIGWAWSLTVVLSIIVIVLNAISIVSGNPGGIVSIIISAIIIYYLYRPHVKSFFGKGSAPPAPQSNI